MTETRIDPLAPPYEPDVEQVFKSIMPPGREPLILFRSIARNKRVLERLRAGNLLDRGSITLREREIVIDRTTARCGSEYEWGVHVTFFAGKAKLTRDQLRAIAAGAPDDPAWDEREAALIRLVDELHDTSRISDALFSDLSRYWDSGQIVELIALVGFYHTISFLTNGLGIVLEDWAARFPEA